MVEPGGQRILTQFQMKDISIWESVSIGCPLSQTKDEKQIVGYIVTFVTYISASSNLK